MRRYLISAIALCALAASASADPCKASLDALSALLDNIESLGHDASGAALACVYHGPDDAAFDKLKTRYTKVLRTNISDPPAGCVKDTKELAVTFQMAAQAMGERVGVAFRACSVKAQAKIADMRKQNKSDAEIGDAMKQMIQPIVDAAMSKH
jgi:hypothetical protein